jgi:hypothetical protein
MTNTYMEFPYSRRSLEARLWSKKHQFDKVRMEYICINPTKKYSNFPISLQIKTSKHSYKGDYDNFAEPIKAEYTWLEMDNLDLLCKQLAQILILERGNQGFIKFISVELYNEINKRTIALKRYHNGVDMAGELPSE